MGLDTSELKARIPLRTGAVVGGAATLGLMPLLWNVLLAPLGIVGLAILGVGGISGMCAIPYFAQKYEDKLAATLKEEAKKKTIEELESVIARADEAERSHAEFHDKFLTERRHRK